MRALYRCGNCGRLETTAEAGRLLVVIRPACPDVASIPMLVRAATHAIGAVILADAVGCGRAGALRYIRRRRGGPP